MASQLAIFNMALGRIGSSIFIQSIDERSNQNSVCSRFYADVRDRVLSELDWGFARKFAELQDIGTPPVGWQYRYRYPIDCLAVRRIIDANGYEVLSWEVVDDENSGGLALVANAYRLPALPFTVQYTARMQNSDLFSQKFTTCLIWALTLEIAMPLSAKPEYIKEAGPAYALALTQAMAQDQNEKKENIHEQNESEFERARR